MKKTSPKLIGEWVEMKFMARAADEGLTVSKPYGDSAPFDFIVGRRQPLHRVQVRGTSCLTNGRCYVCRITHTYPPVRYTTKEIDFMAVFVIPCRAWYLIPVRSIQPVQRFVSLYPHKANAAGRMEQYREAWHLLGRGSRTQKQLARLPGLRKFAGNRLKHGLRGEITNRKIRNLSS